MLRKGIFVVAVSSVASIAAAHAADMAVKALPAAEPIPALSGYLEIYAGGAWNRESEFSGPENTHAWVLGGAGRVNYFWSPNWSVQFDVQGDGANYRGFGVTPFSAHGYLVAGHVSWRNQQGLVGVLGGAGDVSPDEIYGVAYRHGLIGAEGQLYWNQFTFYGQAGYDSSIDTLSTGPGTVATIWAWFVRGTGRYYATPNLRLEGTVQYSSGSHDFTAAPALNVGFNTLLWRGKVEYKLPTSPFSIFGAYQGTRSSFLDVPSPIGGNEGVTDHRLLVGFRIYFGDNTLLQNDRSGATLDVIEPLLLNTPQVN
jgi:hypothetical protein